MMKRIVACLLLLVIAGCASPMISENGSFRKSLKPEYYVKNCYQYASTARESAMLIGGWALLGAPGALVSFGVSQSMSDVQCNLDMDQAISECITRAYLYAKQYRCFQIDVQQPVEIYVEPWYFKEKITGMEIRVVENIPNKEILVFTNYREVRIDEAKSLIIPHRENVPENEALTERRKYISGLPWQGIGR